jgi:hypothetical protein
MSTILYKAGRSFIVTVLLKAKVFCLFLYFFPLGYPSIFVLSERKIPELSVYLLR